MCGIIAIQGSNIEDIKQKNIGAMLACLKHRGPDDIGSAVFPRAILGQTRLSIIDLSDGGHQPMHDNSGDFSITFNGEIYNYKELRGQLEAEGHVFSSESDTEVILKAYRAYGTECVTHLDGMFAFAIWDNVKQHLFVARDRFGKKPFYFTHINNMFIGASEIKAIFESGLMKGSVNADALDDYLRWGYIAPNKTIYNNIDTLLPAHAGIVKDGEIRTWQYWSLKKKKINPTYDEAREEIKRLLENAVQKRMVADVEVGALLSGGVDSTLTSYFAQKYSTYTLKTFAVGYEGHKNELPFAKQAADKIGTDHYVLPITSDLTQELENIIGYMDEPHADTSNFPQHMISGLAASKVKVILTGDGADELFMGYGWYQKKWHTPRWRLDWRLRSPFAIQQKMITIYKRHERKALIRRQSSATKKIIDTITKNFQNTIDRINVFDLQVYLPAQLLTKIDRTSMMHSLEARAPFLDTQLAEYVFSLPTEFKMDKSQSKIILKDILAEIFPAEFVYRKKQGFGAPLDNWLKGEHMQQLINKTLENDCAMYKYIDKDHVLKVRDNYKKGKRNSGQKLWLLFCLALWFNKHEKYHAS